jgi:uncharacterized protein YegP (UPF0339 family)
MAKFVIIKRSNGEFQFNLKAQNGEVVLTSEGYVTKSACFNGIDSVKTNSAKDTQYERRMSRNGQHYFVLKAGNGQIIGSSETYTSTSARDSGIETVKKNAPIAITEDLAV